MGEFIPRYKFWNPGTWAIPQLYWDAFSNEQRFHAICKQLGKVIAYADYLGINVDNIAARLKAIEDGELDEYIQTEIEQWFEDNQPAIIAAIQALDNALPIADFDSEHTVKDAIQSLGSIIPETDFDSEHTVKDAIQSLGSIIPETDFDSEHTVKDALDEISFDIASLLRETLAFSATPIHEGIIRINTNTFTGDPSPDWYWAQGTCVNGSDIYVLLSGASGEEKTGIYKKTIGADSVSFVKEISAYHGSDIIFIPAIDEYWISKGSDGIIYRYDSVFDLVGNFIVGSSANLLAYDKATEKVYINDYWGALYEIDPHTRTVTEISIEINSDSAKQSMCAHNNVLFVLYSNQSNIECYDLVALKRLGKIDIDEANIWSYYMGETEGFDTDETGNLFFTSHTTTRDSSIHQNHIWKIDFIDHSHENAGHDIYQRDIAVDPHTDANMLTHQNPTGTSANAFVTLDEALAFVYKHPHISRIILKGDHTMEQPSITLPNVCIEGDTGNHASLGRLTVTNGCLELANLTFNPQTSVADFISGYRNGCMVIFSNVTKAAGATPTSGYDIRQQGVLCHKNTLKTGNANFAD